MNWVDYFWLAAMIVVVIAIGIQIYLDRHAK